MNDESPIQLVTTKSDKDIAAELKTELLVASEMWCKTCTKALSLGFVVQAQFAPNAFNQVVVQQLSLNKVY